MRLLLFLVLTLSFFTSAIAQSSSPQDRALDQMTQLVEAEVFAGVGAGTAVNGRTTWMGAAGWSDAATKRPFTDTTLTRIASIAKPMTAVAVMQLVESGKMQLADPVGQYLPEFAEGPGARITIQQLLAHTAGIAAYANGKEEANTKSYASLQEAVTLFADRELLFAPGSQFAYTTYGYVVLGLLIERVSGLTYEEYLRQHIWQPANMTNTSVERANQSYPGKSQLYHQHKPGKIKPAQVTDLSDRIPGGGVQSTVQDVLRFGNALLAGDLLSPASLALMSEASGLKTTGNAYGLGWYLYGDNPALGKIIGHTGAQNGCSAMLFLAPEKNLVVVVLSNTSGAMQAVSDLAVALLNDPVLAE